MLPNAESSVGPLIARDRSVPAAVTPKSALPPLRAASTRWQSFLSFLCLTEKCVRGRLTYRLSILLSLVANAVGYSVFLLVWSEVYRSTPENSLIPRERLFPYLAMAFVLNFSLTLLVEPRVGLRLERGLITADLLKPLGFSTHQLAQALSDFLTNFIIALPILAIAALSFGRQLAPGGLPDAALGTLSLALAFLVNFGVSYLAAQTSFVTNSYYGIYFTRNALHQVFSGLAAPLVLFPEPMAHAARWLPFRHVIETPVLIWLGQADRATMLWLVAQQIVWATALLALASFSFRLARHRLQIQGG